MKTKNWLARLFMTPAARKKLKEAEEKEKLRQAALFKDELRRNEMQRNLAMAMMNNRYGEVAALLQTYRETYGALSGDEKIFVGGVYVEETEHWYKVSWAAPFELADPLMRDFFTRLSAGEEVDAAAYQAKCDLQRKLFKAVKCGYVAAAAKLLAQGADINYPYARPYPLSDTWTLWDMVRDNKPDLMYRFFIRRTDCPAAAAARKEYDEEEKWLASLCK